MPPVGQERVIVRPVTTDDREQIIRLAADSLGWKGDDRDRAFFRWKHDENPFGTSLAWVAVDGERIVGFRSFMRWDVEGEGVTHHLVRAVDTATHREFRGRGIFRRLTTLAVAEMTAAGIGAVFNLPNAASRAGYLSMGWSDVGRPTLGLVPNGVLTVARVARGRPAAAKWSEPVTVGDPVLEALGGDSQIGPMRFRRGWTTVRSPAYLRWRYGFAPLNYRAVEVRGGLCIFRVRRRGEGREVAICEWLSDCGDARSLRRLVRAAGDYGVGIGLSPRRHGALPLPRQGPMVTWRPLARPGVPTLSELGFGLGDVELF